MHGYISIVALFLVFVSIPGNSQKIKYDLRKNVTDSIYEQIHSWKRVKSTLLFLAMNLLVNPISDVLRQIVLYFLRISRNADKYEKEGHYANVTVHTNSCIFSRLDQKLMTRMIHDKNRPNFWGPSFWIRGIGKVRCSEIRECKILLRDQRN